MRVKKTGKPILRDAQEYLTRLFAEIPELTLTEWEEASPRDPAGYRSLAPLASSARWGRMSITEFATAHRQGPHFALVNLGLVESLASGVLSATEALQCFYHAENCLYVRKHLRNKEANAIMSHGVQLPDLFEFLPAEVAQREFYHELETMRSLCLKLLEKERAVSVKPASRSDPNRKRA